MADITSKRGSTVMQEYLQIRRWIWAAELLSLDLVRPVYEYLGLGIRFEESLRGILRDGLLGRLAPGHATANTVLDEPLKLYTESIVPALGVLAAAFGEEARGRLQYWVLYIYETDDNPWMPYAEFFSTWSSEVRRTGHDAIGLSFNALQVAYEVREAMLTDDIKDLIGHATQPLSDWDRRLFARRGASELPPGSDYVPFVDEIYLCVGMNRFQRYFRRLASSLDARDREAIESAVAKQSTPAEPLLRIDELPILSI